MGKFTFKIKKLSCVFKINKPYKVENFNYLRDKIVEYNTIVGEFHNVIIKDLDTITKDSIENNKYSIDILLKIAVTTNEYSKLIKIINKKINYFIEKLKYAVTDIDVYVINRQFIEFIDNDYLQKLEDLSSDLEKIK